MEEYNLENFHSVAEILKQTLYFNKLAPNELEDIAKAVTLERYDKDHIIFREHELGNSLFIIAEGRVEISIEADDYSKKILSIREKYEGFGELAMIDNQERTATVKCLEPTTVIRLFRENFEQLINSTGGFSSSIAFVLTNIIRNNTELIINDLTKRNKLLSQSVQQLQELQEIIIKNEKLIAVGKFASRIVHELKNMLNQTYGSIQLIKNVISKNNYNKTNELDPLFSIITNSIKRMNGLSMEILDFTQGKMKLNMEVIDISSYLKSYIENNIKENLNFYEISIETNINCPYKIFIDTEKMDRALDNLINNAIDSLTRRKEPLIKINCFKNPDENKITIEIEDNGIGIPEKEMEYIFNQFYSYAKSHGTGLGLTICREIITIHFNGKIHIQSTEDKGTKVIIKLPIK